MVELLCQPERLSHVSALLRRPELRLERGAIHGAGSLFQGPQAIHSLSKRMLGIMYLIGKSDRSQQLPVRLAQPRFEIRVAERPRALDRDQSFENTARVEAFHRIQ